MINTSQEEWDAQLVDAFYNAGDAPMWRLLDGKDVEEFVGILRVPQAFHLYLTVSHFISNQIPKLGKILWECNSDKTANILAALKKSKLDTIKQKVILGNESRALKRHHKESLSEMSISGKRTHASKCNGTAWKTCS